MGDVVITYEVLFEILRKEKNNPELQQLDPTFYADVVRYMKEKEEILQDREHADPFEAGHELANIGRILKELWERRERKIITLALNKSRTSQLSVDTKHMLDEEREAYERFLAMFTAAKEGILKRLLAKELPRLSFAKEEGAKRSDATDADGVMVRFLDDVKKFVGSELEVYGPFAREDIAQLPKAVAKILIDKHVAEEMKEQ